jgi:hypothetical protein
LIGYEITYRLEGKEGVVRTFFKPRISPLSLLIASAICLAYGCATAPPAESGASATPVQVYEMDPYVGKSYEIVHHFWADSWRSAFFLPTYSKREDASADLQTEAARLNADAVISVNCLDQRGSTWFKGDAPAYLCYGVAIKLRPSPG